MNITKENIVYELSSIGNIEYINGNINITGLSNINQTLSNHYLIYEIFDRQNNKYYIGQHNTVDPLDDYMGSGFYLEHAKQKYGIDNFVKIIIADFDNYEDMNEAEKYFVQLSDCYPQNDRSYNLKEGGSHGQHTDETKKVLAQKASEQWNNYSDEEKDRLRKLMSEMNSGIRNPMYGKDPLENKTDEEMRYIKFKRRTTMINRSKERQKEISDNARKNLLKRMKDKKTFDEMQKKSLETRMKNRECWVNNGKINRKIKKKDLNEYLNNGYVLGATRKLPNYSKRRQWRNEYKEICDISST